MSAAIDIVDPQTPTPLEDTAVNRFLSNIELFEDGASDALLFPTDKPSEWVKSLNAIRSLLFTINEKRDNGGNDSNECRLLADILLENLKLHAEEIDNV
jgi:hypothetical protein